MNLFIDTVSNPAKIILFSENRDIINYKEWDIKGNESSLLIPKIDEILKDNNLKYENIDNLVIINGPGSFTGIRTSVLAVNTINYIIDKKITAINYFDLFKKFPIIKSSSKRDCFVKFEKNSNIEIIENETLINILKDSNINTIYGEINSDIFKNIKIIDKIDYISIIKELKFDNNKQVQALYIKKPNIS